MPRNSSGTYSLPAGNPVVTNTLIQSTWANTTLSDVSTAMTDSLDRNGRGAMLAPLKNVDGTAVAPSITFSSEGTLGAYRVSAGVLGIAVGGALVLSVSATGLSFTTPLVLPIGSATAPSLTFTANTNTGIYSPATNQLAITTNGAQRVLIDATGNVALATGTLTLTAGQQLAFAATGANLITASNATGTLALQTGGANTRLSIDAAGLTTIAGNTGIGGAPALGRLQVFGGSVVIDNAQAYGAKSSGGTGTNLLVLDGSNNLLVGNGAAVATQQFSTAGTLRVTIDGSGNVGIASGTLVLSATSAFIGHNATTGALAIGAASTITDGTARFELYDTSHATLAKQIAYRGDIHNWTKSTAGNALMSLDGSGNLAAVGSVAAAAGSGFISTSFVTNAQNPIWRFGNALTYGLSYFQGTSGADGTNDTLGFHFGTATAAGSFLQVSGAGTKRGIIVLGGASTTTSNVGNVSGTLPIDCSLSNVFRCVLTGNVTTFSITNMQEGQTVNILLTQDGTGSRTLAMTGIKWPGGVAPTLSTAASATDLMVLSRINGNFYGSLTKAMA